MKVKDISLKEVHSADSTTTVNEAASMMKRHGVGILPVCEDGRLLGMLTDRDIVIGCVAAGMDVKECQVKEFMTSEPVTIAPNMDIEEAAEVMGKEQVRRLPVVEDGNLVGMLSLGDIAMALDKNDVIANTLRRISSPSQAATL
jgi:CBS domain-containing protein